MYKIGDRIVYPMHGAGVIEAIEEREILGLVQKYYVLKIPVGDMKVMIPISNMKNVGIRDVINSSIAEEVLLVFKEDVEEKKESNWNKRYRDNMDKLKTGDIFKVAEVVHTLMIRERDKGLSTGEKKMLGNAKQILVSELVLARGVEEANIENIMNEYIYNNKAKAQ